MSVLNSIGLGINYAYFSGNVDKVNKNNTSVEKQSNQPSEFANKSDFQTPSFSEPQMPIIREGIDPAEYAVRGRIKYLDDGNALNAQETEETKSPSEVMEEAECQTCENRKYQDGSDDPGVSFKTATNIAPEQVASAVRGHEQEHVTREQAKAKRENREVVSQSVTIHTSICPECGKVYVSGGTTRTTTRANTDNMAEKFTQKQPENNIFQGVA